MGFKKVHGKALWPLIAFERFPHYRNLFTITRDKLAPPSSAAVRRSQDRLPAVEYQIASSSIEFLPRQSSLSDSSNSNSPEQVEHLAPPKDQNYESGFASASSVEENSFSIATRRRRPVVEPMIAKLDPWRIEDDGEEILDMSAGERIIWIISAFWAAKRLYDAQAIVENDTPTHLARSLVVFTCLTFFATLLSFRAKPKSASDISSSYSSDDVDGDVNIEKIADSPSRKRRVHDVKTFSGRNGSVSSEKVTKLRDTRVGRSRLFGKSRACFRYF
jgi:hypothetical protein